MDSPRDEPDGTSRSRADQKRSTRRSLARFRVTSMKGSPPSIGCFRVEDRRSRTPTPSARTECSAILRAPARRSPICRSNVVCSAAAAGGGHPLQHSVRRRVQFGRDDERVTDRETEEGPVRDLDDSVLDRHRRSNRLYCRISSLDNHNTRDLRDLIGTKRVTHTPRDVRQSCRAVVLNPLRGDDQIPYVRRILAKKKCEEVERPLFLGEGSFQSAKFFCEVS